MPLATTPAKVAISVGFKALRRMIISGAESAMTAIMNARTVPSAAPLPISASTIGMMPAALVYIRDASSKSLASEVVTKQLFNLTKAETALAMELANGLSLEEAAEVLNIRRNTARAHLRSIFSKTGVRRQTELVRIFLNSVAWLGNK